MASAHARPPLPCATPLQQQHGARLAAGAAPVRACTRRSCTSCRRRQRVARLTCRGARLAGARGGACGGAPRAAATLLAAQRSAASLPRRAGARLVGVQRAQRGAPAPRCHGGSDDASAEGGVSVTAAALPPATLAAYAARPVYVLTEPITLDKLTALMVRAPPPHRALPQRLVCAFCRAPSFPVCC
jgi:hypothetical protein